MLLDYVMSTVTKGAWTTCDICKKMVCACCMYQCMHMPLRLLVNDLLKFQLGCFFGKA